MNSPSQPQLLRGRRPRTAGFRFSFTDGIAIAVCAVATVIAWQWIGHVSLIAPIALGHFFLFCNVFRVHRNYELIWALSFILNFSFWVLGFPDGSIPFGKLFAVQIPITTLLITLEVRSRRYHGIFSRRMNPNLHLYLNDPG